MMIRLTLITMLVTWASITYAAGPTGLYGIITKVNPDAKAFTIKGKEGEAVIKYDDKTKFHTIKPSEASILTDGCQARVNGKFSEDETVVSATAIERLPDSFKNSAINAKESQCFGIFHKKDDVMSVTVGDKAIAIKPAEKMKYHNRVSSDAGDLEKGKAVWTWVVPVENSDERLAQSIVISTPASTAPTKPAPAKPQSAKPTPAKPTKQTDDGNKQQPAATAPATAPAETSKNQPTGPTSGSVMEVSVQDLSLKVAKDGDPKRVFVYNITMFTEVFVNGKSAKIEDIKKGMKVTVTSPDGKDAVRVDAGGGLPPIKPTPKKPKK